MKNLLKKALNLNIDLKNIQNEVVGRLLSKKEVDYISCAGGHQGSM